MSSNNSAKPRSAFSLSIRRMRRPKCFIFAEKIFVFHFLPHKSTREQKKGWRRGPNNHRASRTMRCEAPFGAPLSIIKARLRCKGLIPFRRFLKEPKTHRSDLFEKGFNWQTGNNQPALNLHPEKAPGAKKPARCAPVRPPEGFIPPPSAASGGCLLAS